MVFDAYVAAEHGDPSGLALMSLAYDFMIPNAFVWGDLFLKGGSADFDPDRDYVNTLRAPDTALGSPVAYLVWAPLSQAFLQSKFSSERAMAQPGDVETLLISGSIDFSTPAEYAANELLPQLKNGKQVILQEMGHVSDVWNIQPHAMRRLLTRFFDTGVVDSSQFQYEPMNFKVRLGFPLLAKLLLASGVLFIAGLLSRVRRFFWHRRTSQGSVRRG